MRIRWRTVGMYAAITINLTVGFALLFLANQLDLFQPSGMRDFWGFVGLNVWFLLACVLLFLAFAAPAGAILYYCNAEERWVRIWFRITTVLCLPLFIWLIVYIADEGWPF